MLIGVKNPIRILTLVALAGLASSCGSSLFPLSSVPAASTETTSQQQSSVAATSEATSVEASTEATSIERSSEATSEASSEQVSPEISSEQSSQAVASERSSAAATSEQSSQASSEQSSQASSQQSSQASSQYSSISSSSVSQEVDPKWDIDFNLRGLTFRNALGSLIRASGKTASYNACISIGAKAAAYPKENSETFVPFYHDTTVTAKQSECNREHTWPNSRGGNAFENDPVMVRPTLVKDNSARGNKYYGTTSAEWDPASISVTARGEAARIILYCATAYGETAKVSLNNNPGSGTSQLSMGTLKTLLAWNRTYAPTEFEKLVNDRYDGMGYRRNPFVDHPEYADYIWNDDGLLPAEGQEEERTWYDQVTDYADLDGKTIAFAAESNSVAGTYYSMTSVPKAATTPWYLGADEAFYKDGKMAPSSSCEWFTLSKTAENKYVIANKSGKTLYGYVAGTHYSVGFAAIPQEIEKAQGGTTVSSISNEWAITASGSGANLVAGSVYLEYYVNSKGASWQGYSKAPSKPIMLFVQA